MSYVASVDYPFGDGVHTFRLRIKQVEELQTLTACGPEFLVSRILNGQWQVADIRHTIRLGLIGAGMPAVDALRMIENYAGEGQLMALKTLAVNILAAFLQPPEGEPPVGESQGETNPSPTDDGGSDGSTNSEEPSA